MKNASLTTLITCRINVNTNSYLKPVKIKSHCTDLLSCPILKKLLILIYLRSLVILYPIVVIGSALVITKRSMHACRESVPDDLRWNLHKPSREPGQEKSIDLATAHFFMDIACVLDNLQSCRPLNLHMLQECSRGWFTSITLLKWEEGKSFCCLISCITSRVSAARFKTR